MTGPLTVFMNSGTKSQPREFYDNPVRAVSFQSAASLPIAFKELFVRELFIAASTAWAQSPSESSHGSIGRSRLSILEATVSARALQDAACSGLTLVFKDPLDRRQIMERRPALTRSFTSSISSQGMSARAPACRGRKTPEGSGAAFG